MCGGVIVKQKYLTLYLINQTEETLGRYDGDGDGIITLVEYLEDPYLDFDEDEIRDRKKIFKEIMDNDGDGKVDRRELIAYLGM